MDRSNDKAEFSEKYANESGRPIWLGDSVLGNLPYEASSLRLLRALAVEMHENWLETPRYLSMEALREQRKTELRKLLAAA